MHDPWPGLTWYSPPVLSPDLASSAPKFWPDNSSLASASDKQSPVCYSCNGAEGRRLSVSKFSWFWKLKIICLSDCAWLCMRMCSLLEWDDQWWPGLRPRTPGDWRWWWGGDQSCWQDSSYHTTEVIFTTQDTHSRAHCSHCMILQSPVIALQQIWRLQSADYYCRERISVVQHISWLVWSKTILKLLTTFNSCL